MPLGFTMNKINYTDYTISDFCIETLYTPYRFPLQTSLNFSLDFLTQDSLAEPLLPRIYLLMWGGNLAWEVGGFNPFCLSERSFETGNCNIPWEKGWGNGNNAVGKGMGNSEICNNSRFAIKQFDATSSSALQTWINQEVFAQT